MELSYPLVRVPFEKANKVFRLYHKQLTREIAQAVAQIEELDEDGGQQPGHRMDVDATITKLADLGQKLHELKNGAKLRALEQQSDLKSCVTRVQHLEVLETEKAAQKIGEDPPGRRDHSVNDRLIADYLLCQGYLESAKIIRDTKELGDLVDFDLYAECQAVLLDLQAHNTATAIAWCTQNGSRLRRLQSPLEFHLRLQEFIEFVRSNKPLEAIQYARAYLTPLAMQNDKQAAHDAAIAEVQVAMATLAFEDPQQCGIEAYMKIFAMDRWQDLVMSFRTTFFEVYGVHDPPSLCIALHAGLSTLNTRTCHRTRDANVKARLVRSNSGKERRENNEAKDGDAGDYDDDGSNVDGNGTCSKLVSSYEKSKKTKHDDAGASSQADANHSPPGSAKKRSKHGHGSEPPVPTCPTCSEVGSQLCAGLPFAYHPHSRLVCRVTQNVMDEHNPPLVLPNGRVYSKQGIDLLTQRSVDGMIKCMDTHELFAPTDVKPVYIL